MSRPTRLRAAAALAVTCLLGLFGAGSLLAGSAFADDGSGSSSPPVSVTIPGATASPTPTPTPSSSPSSGSSSSGDDGGGQSTTPPPPHVAGTAPAIPKHPLVGTLKVTILPKGVFGTGDMMTVSASGFDPSEEVQLVIYYRNGKPLLVGSFKADKTGAFSDAFLLPKLDAGTDTVQLTGWDSSKVGTGHFLFGSSWVAAVPSSQRVMWLWVGGVAGFGALAGLVWFGFVSLRRRPAAGLGV